MHPVNTGCLPLKFSANSGVNGRSHRGGRRARHEAGILDHAIDRLVSERASANWKSSTVTWIFLLYAPTSAAIVKMFQCRRLGEQLSVLTADNTITCCDDTYLQYWLIAGV